MSKAVIAGGTGFLGRAVVCEFASNGYEVVVLSRSARELERASVRMWDAQSLGDWVSELEGAACVVNLSGSSIMVRWTPQNQRRILDSRADSGRLLAEAVRSRNQPPKCFLSASGIGYYGDTGDRVVDETGAKASGFLADVCERWEDPVLAFSDASTRGVVLRIGFVLGRYGGLAPLAKLARMYLGGRLGSGRQWMSWIHVRDVARMFRWAAEGEASGVYNAVAPEPVRNAEFMATLRKVLGRPWAPPLPALAVRLAAKVTRLPLHLGLESTGVVPKRAVREGFVFEFPDLEGALQDALV